MRQPAARGLALRRRSPRPTGEVTEIRAAANIASRRLTSAGLAAAGMPNTYPRDGTGNLVAHQSCQVGGQLAYDAGEKGIVCRSATAAGTELAWSSRPGRHALPRVRTRAFADWYWPD